MNRTENVFRRIAVAAALMIAIASAVPALGAGGADPAAYDLENRAAALDENWSEVAKILGTVDESELSPVGRLLKGHACLALNRNNESLCLFLYSAGQADLEHWDRWTQYFMTEHPDAEIAMYLRADAHARLEKWQKARERLDAFLRRYPQLDEVPVTFREKEPHVALALNARGVVLCALGEDGLASVDINAARKVCPEFADAHATAGARAVLISQGASAAKEAFDEAIRHSTQFAMAFNGRACARIALSPREFDKAESDLEAAAKIPECDRLATYKLLRLEEIRIGRMQAQAQKLLANNPGAPLLQRLDNAARITGNSLRGLWIKGDRAANSFFGRQALKDALPATVETRLKVDVHGIGGSVGPAGDGKVDLTVGRESKVTNNPMINKQLFNATREQFQARTNSLNGQLQGIGNRNDQLWQGMKGGVHTASGEDHMEGKPWRLLTLFGLRYNILPEIPEVSLAKGSPLARETEEVQ